MFMEIAEVVAKRATCMRLNVGAVIVHDNSVVSMGYNGVGSGEPHCAGNRCPGRVGGCTLTIHAEDNALQRLPEGIEGDLDLYVTDSPCAHCFEKIVADHRIRRVFFRTPYRITDHLENHLWDIGVYRVLPAGYVIDWDTKALVDDAK